MGRCASTTSHGTLVRLTDRKSCSSQACWGEPGDKDGEGVGGRGRDREADGDWAADGEGDGGVDCNDDNAGMSPDLPEVCGDGLDNDCDGLIDGDDVDAIIQCGTNLSTVDIFPTLEHWLEKPLIPINIATIWHALRACGIQDPIVGKGRLLEEF